MLQMSSGRMFHAQKAASNAQVLCMLVSEFITGISDIGNGAWVLRGEKGQVR